MERGIKRENGAVILAWETQFPTLPAGSKGEERIAAFYRRLEEGAQATVEQLTEAARAAYTAKKNPRFFPFYRLVITVQVTEDGDKFFSAIRRTTLTRGGKQLVNQKHADLFWKKTGHLCPRGMLRLWGYHLPRGKGERYMEGGDLHCLAKSL